MEPVLSPLFATLVDELHASGLEPETPITGTLPLDLLPQHRRGDGLRR